MKILRLTTGLDFGGVEKMYELFGQYYQGEHEYVFLALGKGGRTAKKLTDWGYQALSFEFDNPSVYNPKVTLALYRWLKKNKFDLIHSASAEANFHGVIAGKLAGVRTLMVEEIGIPNHSKLGRFMFKQVYRWVNDFVWESTAIEEHIVKLGEAKAGVGRVIHNPVAIPEVEVELPPKHKDEYLIASIGRLTPVKNFEMLIELVASLQKAGHNAKLLIIGEGDHRPELEARVKALQVEALVDLPGFSDKPTNAIAHADLYIQPSFSEGFGISVVEAMMVNLPAIGSHVGGIVDIIDNGKNGWLMDPKAGVEALQSLVLKIMNMPAYEVQAIANTGKEQAIERFGPEIYIEKLEQFYLEVHERK